MYLRTLEICVLAYMTLILQNLSISTDIDKLLMVEKCIRAGICNTNYWYAKANNKYMKDYYKNKELSDIQYWKLWIMNCENSK